MGATPVVPGLPEGFQLDDLPEGFQLDEPAAATPTAPQTESGYTHPMARFGSGALREVGTMLNPMTYARALKALGELGTAVNPAANLRAAVSGEEPPIAGVLRGAAAIPGHVAEETKTPEGLGRLAAQGGSLLIPGAAEGAAAKIAGVLRRSRATNIVRAVKGGKELVPVVTKAGDAAELPVSLTQGSLARKLAVGEAAAGEVVGTTKAALPGTIPASDIAERLPVIGETVEGIPIAADRGLRRAVEGRRAYWEGVATEPGFSGEIPRATVANLKEAAQAEAARGGAYAKGGIGLPVSPGAKAAAEEATALRSAVLDTAGLSAEDAAKVATYEQALGKSSLATALSEPAQMEHLRRVSGAGGGDWKAALAGRALVPLAGAGGGALAGAAVGGMAASPVGALAGASVAAFMRSTPWQTLSAATKLKAIRALESGGVEAFRGVVIPAAIADAQRRRAAEHELLAQGEGVTTP